MVRAQFGSEAAITATGVRASHQRASNNTHHIRDVTPHRPTEPASVTLELELCARAASDG